jgi:flagellar basal body-associated protein FliL
MATNPQQAEAAAPAQANAAAAPAEGGFKAWLPLIVTIVAMPALAYATTMFIIVPQLKKTALQAAAAPAEDGHGSEGGGEASGHGSGHGSSSSSGHGSGESKGHGGHGSAKGRVNYPFGKVLVNVSGSMGTRYLLANLTLVGATPDFKNKIDDNKDQLVDLAASALSTKTIADLEKPGSRNLIRSELIAVFNGALGNGVVQEIYFTEFAIQ